MDDQDVVWLSDFGANAPVRFDPAQEAFEVFPLPSPGAEVRQLLGRPGEVWGAESGTDKLVVIRTSSPANDNGQSMTIPGNDQVDEPWLDEALVQYATLLYYGDVYGPPGKAGFRRSLERRWERVDRAGIPIGMPVRDYWPAEYSAIVYSRAPLFIEALAETTGQDTFGRFLRDYYRTYRWGIATADDFKQLAEHHCACNLTPLFGDWVYRK